jgi:type II secretory pathway pseudopilin PulG
MIVTFLSGGFRSLAARVHPLASRLVPLRAETGDTLIEVVISALLVGIVVVGTLTGFGAVNNATALEREHAEAIALANQSQEQLRSDPASTLETVGETGHAYTQTIGGMTYTITQKAKQLPESGSSAKCNVTETKRQVGNSFSISSAVTWLPHKYEKTAKSVTAASVITPPTGSAIEVDVGNAPVPTSGVSGVTSIVTYTASETTTTTSIQQTTGSEGCSVFSGIPATSALVEIEPISGYVTVSGASKYPPKEVTIAPNYTTHYEVVYNKAGAIDAEFAYNGAAKRSGKNNSGLVNVEEQVTGDTFIALNTKMKQAPEFEIGSTHYGPLTGELYEPLSAEKSENYKTEAESPKNLFPFTESENGYWSVYAGDCPNNNPETVTSGSVKLPEKVLVSPGAITKVKVPTSYTTLNVYNQKESKVVSAGSEAYKYLETAHAHPVTITNVKCESYTPPDNETAINPKHLQTTTIGSESGGHLSYPFQPFGSEFTLCLVSAEEGKTYTAKYSNTALTGGSVSIYLPQRPTAEVAKEREEKEAAYKTKEAEYKAKEAAYKTKETEYKAKEAYKNKKAEGEAKKTAYGTEKTKYTTEKTKYETEKTKYETEKTKYTTEKTKYETEKAKYTTEKGKYETEKAKYTTEKGKYTTEKENYEKYKKEYEKTGKSEYKTKYEAAKTAYLKAETEYKAAETAYKAAEAAYKKAETEYKTAETEYKAAETPYKAAETAYKTAETAYKTAETEYKKDESEYETDLKEAGEYETPLHEYETDHSEYLADKAEYETDKAQYETAKAEEKEGPSVTVVKGTTCS